MRFLETQPTQAKTTHTKTHHKTTKKRGNPHKKNTHLDPSLDIPYRKELWLKRNRRKKTEWGEVPRGRRRKKLVKTLLALQIHIYLETHLLSIKVQ